MKGLNRRDFLKYGTGGAAALVVGNKLPWLFKDQAHAATAQSLRFTITDAIKDMATNNVINSAQCYFWVFKEESMPAEVPGPHIFVAEGDEIEIRVTNALDEPHAFSIPGLGFTTGEIKPGETKVSTFTPFRAGTYLYYDDLNEPVNRVMGLHGAIIVMPNNAPVGKNFTPYSDPPEKVQKIFDDLGSTAWWPGLPWEGGDPATNTMPFRQTIWLLHQASPNLFAEVGDYPAGEEYPAEQFVQKFLHDPFSNTNANSIPQYFTISGQAGHFSHNNPYINPNMRIGEPVLVRVLNAGLWTHSLHLHANHFYVLNVANAGEKTNDFNSPGSIDPRGIPEESQGRIAKMIESHQKAVAKTGSAAKDAAPLDGKDLSAIYALLLGGGDAVDKRGNLIWVDAFSFAPMDIVDVLVPYMRPPDIPNVRGIGRADAGLPTASGTTWPPNEELNLHIPAVGASLAEDADGNIVDLNVQLSPMAYPMHDHSEPSQTSQGGNYNMGMIAGMNITGDRNTPGGVTSFPHQPLVTLPGPLGVFPPTVGPPWFDES